MFMCPVCGYDGLTKPAMNHQICPSCGTQFGYSDAGPEPIAEIHSGLRAYWLNHGASWQSSVIPRPPNWNASAQLIKAGLGFDIPWLMGVRVKVQQTAASIDFG